MKSTKKKAKAAGKLKRSLSPAAEEPVSKWQARERQERHERSVARQKKAEACKKAAELFMVLMDIEDVWTGQNRILSYLGPGYGTFITSVCPKLRHLYKKYIESLPSENQALPNVKHTGENMQFFHTTYRVAFSNPSYFKIWHRSLPRGPRRLARTGWNRDRLVRLLKHKDLQNYCPWSTGRVSQQGEPLWHAVEDGNLDLVKYLGDNGCEWCWCCAERAAELGHLEILKHMHKTGFELGVDICSSAAWHGHFEVLKWAVDSGSEWNETTCNLAIAGGHMEILKWAHENGCPWTEITSHWASSHGQLEALKYIHENGCPWDEETCEQAAEYDCLETLKYAHENGCRWDERTCTAAARSGNLEILRYAHAHGCPWDEETGEAAIDSDDVEIIEYLRQKGCPGL